MYRTHDPACQERSPYYQAGEADGYRDALALANGEPVSGEDAGKSWSYMYREGYMAGAQKGAEEAGIIT